MNSNVLGGTLGVAALAAIFAYGSHEAPVIEQPPAPVLVKQAPAPLPVPKPVQPPAPAAKAVPAPAKQPAPAPATPTKAVIYHRVEQDGSQGPVIACASVKQFAEGKSPADLAALAKQYGVSVADVQRYYICTI